MSISKQTEGGFFNRLVIENKAIHQNCCLAKETSAVFNVNYQRHTEFTLQITIDLNLLFFQLEKKKKKKNQGGSSFFFKL